ncbi:MAG: DNA polymerase III subunit gamma/tau [Natronospirillum sp.]|uniref:DNA polymerase III subunit gamma/tau n=1 Tax=Natronospirillum sp. TaxID=2812955 RepID=UPI0025D4ADE9|nr:DNA polymerase III subunit gamma/tau [Natronospirillum sp.]MCH8550608.1 DNA polymerase III subunit gamma/tau [Natronospirillum sp.]
MSYQVLARKWRPQQFNEMVGQRHVLKALVNALDQDRLHHAYLFTGTRGVGKTTIARLFAKSLNCEEGVSSTPCGVCSSCREIAENRFIDLIEVDAASRTKVEDTRELLDNVQYAPTRGRFKVYLIDEVHMLSNHSFNALLKTLEEPPPHVKFLLATTDPQKLPVTVLSRCLQFNLKSMTPDMVVGHLEEVLRREQVDFEPAALLHLGKAAQGSMRDALSLTDQAVAYGQGRIRETEVAEMLGTVDTRQVLSLIEALCRQDAQSLLAAVDRMAEYTPDWQAMMADLLAMLHRLTVLQLAPSYQAPTHHEALQTLAEAFAPEDIQLYYQLGLQAHRDLDAAPEPRQGFEMALLRMLAFSPDKPTSTPPPLPDHGQDEPSQEPSAGLQEEPSAEVPKQPETAEAEPEPGGGAPAAPEQAAVELEQQDSEIPASEASQETDSIEPEAGLEPEPAPVASEPPQHSDLPEPPPWLEEQHPGPSEPVGTGGDSDPSGQDGTETRFSAATLKALDSVVADPDTLPDCWLDLIPALELTGVIENMMRHAVVRDMADGHLMLRVDGDYQQLYEDNYRHRVEEALQALDVAVVQVDIEFGDMLEETLYQREQRERREAHAAARQSLEQDQVVQTLVREFDAELLADTIEPAQRS